MVQDTKESPKRGPKSNNYRIVDIKGVAEMFRSLLVGQQPTGRQDEPHGAVALTPNKGARNSAREPLGPGKPDVH